MPASHNLRPRLTLQAIGLVFVLAAGALYWRMQPVVREETVISAPDDPAEPEVARHMVSSELRLPFQSDQMKHGPSQILDENGEILERTHWARGRLHGRHEVWHTSRQLAVQGQWNRGKPDGTWRLWLTPPASFTASYPQVALAELYETAFGKNAAIQSEERHYESGRLRSLVRFHRDVKHLLEFRDPPAGSPEHQLIRAQKMTLNGQVLAEKNWKRVNNALVLHGVDKSFDDKDGYAGEWSDGQPAGTWTGRSYDGKEHTVNYEDGHVVAINGQPFEPFTKHIHGRRGEETLAKCRKPLGNDMPDAGYGAIQALRNRFNIMVHKSAAAIFVEEEAQLEKQRQLQLQQPPPNVPAGPLPPPLMASEFGMPKIPGDAALAIWLDSKKLTFRYRSECLWIISQQAARTWNDSAGQLNLDVPAALNEQLDEPLGPGTLHIGAPLESVIETPYLALADPSTKNDFLVTGNKQFELPITFSDLTLRALLEILKTEHDVTANYDGERIVVTVPPDPRPSVQPPYPAPRSYFP